MKLTAGIERPHPDLEQCDFAFSTVFVDPDDDNNDVDDLKVRDAFLEFMIAMLKDYRDFYKDIFYESDGSLPSD